MLELKGMRAGYSQGNPVVHDLDLTIAAGEVVGVLGQNGAGKSTLGKAIFQILPFIQGGVAYRRQSLLGLSPREVAGMGIGLFLQGGAVFPHLTIGENLAFAGSRLGSREAGRRRDELGSYFELLGPKRRADYPLQASYLSGGEKNQLALAMVLMMKPEFIILDEPSAGLSPANVRTLFDILRRVAVSERLSILLIEQNAREVFDFCQRVILMERGKIARETEARPGMGFEEVEKFFWGDSLDNVN